LYRRITRYEPELMEEYAYVLDFFPQGNPLDKHLEHRRRPIAQVVGEKYFMLLEVIPRPGVTLSIGERVYISRGYRDKIAFVYGRISYDDLSSVAKDELVNIVEKIIRTFENVYIQFFNIAEPITIRLHALELLPGIGKKSMKTIIEERKKKPFTSFKDLTERTKIPDPVKSLRDRIISEIMGEEKYYLFVKPPPGKEGAIYLGYLIRMHSMSSSR